MQSPKSTTRFSMSRRGFLGAIGAGATAVAAGSLVACGSSSKLGSGDKSTVAEGWDGETRPLPIPPLADAKASGDTTKYELVAQTGTSEIKPGVSTPTWGFNGPHLGPTLRMRRGEKVAITVRSTLPEVTAVHWHGMHLPAEMDGGPHSPIEPGEDWTASFSVEQPAATLWYHPHPHGLTGVQAYRGLAGMIIIDDDVSEQLELPHEYGVDDVPVVLQDANFTKDGRLDENWLPDLGLLGAVPVVNGITNPHFEVTTQRVRLRILNGSNMQFHNLALSNEAEFAVIASDAGLLAEPLRTNQIDIGPGERVEIVVDCPQDEAIKLRSVGFEDNLGVPDDEYSPDFQLQRVHDLLTLQPAASLAASVEVPGELDPEQHEYPSFEGVTERSFEMNTFEINGQSMDMARVDFTVDHDQPERWVVTNGNADWIHNFHVHDARFVILDMQDTEVAVNTHGWKDTVTIPPGATVTLGVEFGYYPDNNWPYMYHCHMLFHEDAGMMGQFMVVNPGEKPELNTSYTDSNHYHHYYHH